MTLSTIDPCFLASPHIMVFCFVDDLGVSGKSQETIDEFVSKPRVSGFDLEIEGSFEKYLGIKFLKGTLRPVPLSTRKRGLSLKSSLPWVSKVASRI